MTQNMQQLQEKITQKIQNIADSLNDQFNPKLRVDLANILLGGDELRDFQLNPLSNNELNAIVQINANASESNDYYVEQMQDFILHIHRDIPADQRAGISGLMDRVMENVGNGLMANNENAKKSFYYFQNFIENINK